MSDKIQPALTPEEWEAATKASAIRSYDEIFNVASSGRHAVAARALKDQPFGFTHADVALLRSITPDHEGLGGEERVIDELENLADRLAALLPPEATEQSQASYVPQYIRDMNAAVSDAARTVDIALREASDVGQFTVELRYHGDVRVEVRDTDSSAWKATEPVSVVGNDYTFLIPGDAAGCRIFYDDRLVHDIGVA